jgi:peptidoglycan hydrolase-like protein with peptidoglycan-binding domain
LCDTEATPARIGGVQRQLSIAGVYQGPIDGRYDSNTTAAVQRFQAQRHIEDRGYLSYATLSALNVYSQTGYAQSGYYQAPYPYAYPPARPWGYGDRPLTTLDTGVITWPGKR